MTLTVQNYFDPIVSINKPGFDRIRSYLIDTMKTVAASTFSGMIAATQVAWRAAPSVVWKGACIAGVAGVAYGHALYNTLYYEPFDDVPEDLFGNVPNELIQHELIRFLPSSMHFRGPLAQGQSLLQYVDQNVQTAQSRFADELRFVYLQKFRRNASDILKPVIISIFETMIMKDFASNFKLSGSEHSAWAMFHAKKIYHTFFPGNSSLSDEIDGQVAITFVDYINKALLVGERWHDLSQENELYKHVILFITFQIIGLLRSLAVRIVAPPTMGLSIVRATQVINDGIAPNHPQKFAIAAALLVKMCFAATPIYKLLRHSSPEPLRHFIGTQKSAVPSIVRSAIAAGVLKLMQKRDLISENSRKVLGLITSFICTLTW